MRSEILTTCQLERGFKDLMDSPNMRTLLKYFPRSEALEIKIRPYDFTHVEDISFGDFNCECGVCWEVKDEQLSNG